MIHFLMCYINSIYVNFYLTANFNFIFLLAIFNLYNIYEILINQPRRIIQFMDKKLYLIGGTMGIGKTTVSQILKNKLDNAVMLDGDWCWDMHPFMVNDETKAMVMDNICYLLNNFIKCSVYDNIVFCWVMHEQAIIDEILSRLDTSGITVLPISLVCSEAELRRRIQRDVDKGKRTSDVIERSAVRLEMYSKLTTHKLDVTGLTPEETAQKIISF